MNLSDATKLMVEQNGNGIWRSIDGKPSVKIFKMIKETSKGTIPSDSWMFSSGFYLFTVEDVFALNWEVLN